MDLRKERGLLECEVLHCSGVAGVDESLQKDEKIVEDRHEWMMRNQTKRGE